MASQTRRSSRTDPTADDACSEDAEHVRDRRVEEEQFRPRVVPAPPNVLPDVVRNRQRAVAEREASRLARPDGAKSMYRLPHADRKKSAVTSTPSGIGTLTSIDKNEGISNDIGNEEWCGPWSVARQMIAKRDDAKRRREELENDAIANGENHPLDEAMEEFALEQKVKHHPSMQWKSALSSPNNANGKRESLYGKRQKRMDMMQIGKKVPSLYDLCITFLAENVDSVESLGIDTDSDIRTAVMDRLIAEQLLNDDALSTLAEVGIDTLQVSDGSNITEECLSKRLEILLPAGLKHLSLDQCGRCFSTRAVRSIINSQTIVKEKSMLQDIMIGGAYGLLDIDAAQLVKAVAPSSLGFKACNLLGKVTCQSLCDTYSNFTTSSSLVEFLLEDIPLTSDDLNIMISKPATWKNLKRLSLRRVNGIDDSFLHIIFEFCCNSLEYLDLTDNELLSDAVLASLRFNNIAHKLHTLILQGLKHITAIGLETFFTPTLPEMDSLLNHPMMLQVLNLGQCNHNAVTDEVIRLVTGSDTDRSDVGTSDAVYESLAEGIPKYTNISYHPLGSGGLVSLNVQGSTLLTDVAMEYLASNKSPTYRTLEDLNISFCPNVSNKGLGYLIDNCKSQLRTIQVWGNAQLTDDVFDGHQRSADPSLEVEGIWMKKASSRTIR